MNSEDKFWLAVCGIFGAFLISVVTGTAAYNIYEVKAIKQMVVSGADPISAACSVRYMSEAICATQAVLTAK